MFDLFYLNVFWKRKAAEGIQPFLAHAQRFTRRDQQFDARSVGENPGDQFGAGWQDVLEVV